MHTMLLLRRSWASSGGGTASAADGVLPITAAAADEAAAQQTAAAAVRSTAAQSKAGSSATGSTSGGGGGGGGGSGGGMAALSGTCTTATGSCGTPAAGGGARWSWGAAAAAGGRLSGSFGSAAAGSAAAGSAAAGAAAAGPRFTARQLLASLPVSARALVAVVLVEAAAWIAGAVANAALACPKGAADRGACPPERWHAVAVTLAAQLGAAALVALGVADESSLQLAAGALIGAATGAIWLVIEASYFAPAASRGAATALGAAFAAYTLAKLACARAAHARLGWRQHSRVACDLRRKGAGFERSLGMLLGRLRTLQRVALVVTAVNLSSCLALALAGAGAGAGAGQQGSSGVPLPRWPASGLLIAAGLAVLLLGWQLLAALAVVRASRALGLAASIAAPALLGWPAIALLFALLPSANWASHLAARLALLALPALLWASLHVACWWHMRAALALLLSPQGQLLLAERRARQTAAAPAMRRSVSSAGAGDEVPEQLQPLLRGAWLIKAHGGGGGAFGSGSGSANGGGDTPLWSRLLNSGGSGSGGGGSGKEGGRWRYFQLSSDLTTLRWSWNRYALVYHVEALEADGCGAHILCLPANLLPPPPLLCCAPRAVRRPPPPLPFVLPCPAAHCAIETKRRTTQ